MKETLYLSRSFVEFGPFSVTEMQDFHKRGLLKDSDYVSSDAAGAWLHVNEWAATLKAPAALKAATKPAPAAPKAKIAPAPAKKAPAKKAAKKA
ncbi:MAG: hypothetical protein U0984_05065 [Prosthecobacter sp.]|nr:hypothetical protein [Prosthecobacter sp.]